MSEDGEVFEREWWEANRYCVKWEHYRTWTDDDPIDQATGEPKSEPPTGRRFKRYSIRLAGPIPGRFGPGPFACDEKKSFLTLEDFTEDSVETFPFRTYALTAEKDKWPELYKRVREHRLSIKDEGTNGERL